MIPALVVGIASSVILLSVSAVAKGLQDVWWTIIPQALGVSGTSPLWILLVLTLTGVAVGLVVWKVPGHAGPDPATLGLVEAPLPLSVLPSLLLALILMLAGGVSLGPENPIMGVGIGLAYALGTRVMPKSGAPLWLGLATAGMIGAMFGTPVAAALLLSETLSSGESRMPLWDRIFAPMVAAGAGALTTRCAQWRAAVPGGQLPPYPGANVQDLLTAVVLAAAAALLRTRRGVRLSRRLSPLQAAFANPLLALTVGGVLLGVLGMIGGPITLFKGLDEMKELAQNVSQYSPAGLALVTLVKLAALVIAAHQRVPRRTHLPVGVRRCRGRALRQRAAALCAAQPGRGRVSAGAAAGDHPLRAG